MKEKRDSLLKQRRNMMFSTWSHNVQQQCSQAPVLCAEALRSEPMNFSGAMTKEVGSALARESSLGRRDSACVGANCSQTLLLGKDPPRAEPFGAMTNEAGSALAHKSSLECGILPAFVQERCVSRLLTNCFARWFVIAKLGKIDRSIKQHSKNHMQHKLELLEVELEQAMKHKDTAVAWRVVRQIARAVKGSRRQFAHAPKCHPRVNEVIQRYSQKPQSGGWGAQTMTLEHLESLEPDFSHVVVQDDDANVSSFMDKFIFNAHRAKNRKAFTPGDIPNEVWRILCRPQWLLPNVSFKWGLGHEGKFPEPIKFQKMLRHLFATMFATESLPLQCVCNLGVTIPKKTCHTTTYSR